MKGAGGRGKDETESCRQKLPLSLVLICFALSQPSLLDGVMMGVGGTICDVELERRMLQTVSECRGRGYSYPSASNLASWIFLHLSRSPKAHLSQAGMLRSRIKLLPIQQSITSCRPIKIGLPVPLAFSWVGGTSG